jgi:pyruvate dehydrogenase E1 component
MMTNAGAARVSRDEQLTPLSVDRKAALEEIQRRVLWLATNMIHVANRIRPNPDGIKVGGHQASSASVVTVLTELFFDFMQAGDRLSVKPHASPVLHAIQYLLGNLDRAYLPTLRAFHGLQAYPSRTKDPDVVDFSTGSVGLGSVAPNFAALVDRFVRSRDAEPEVSRARFLSLLGDAELDEGSVWEAVAEPALDGLDNLIWVVDLNRQSLDRVVPGIRVQQFENMFRANGWTVAEAKYGTRLLEACAQTPGLREAIDAMPNEQYQYLLRAAPSEIREVLGSVAPAVPDDQLPLLIADLGGHDFQVLRDALDAANRAPGPAVVFAYTIKGWGLPIAGDPLNHSALLSTQDVAALRAELGIPKDDEWAPMPSGSPGARLVFERAGELKRSPRPVRRPPEVPLDLGRGYSGRTSTQRAFGQILTTLARIAPEASQKLVTVSPDVATSTNLGGWINKVGVWEATVKNDPFSSRGPRLIQWQRQPSGQHIELGISETNLLMLLGQLGLADEPLVPIGTLYDPFVARALDAYIYSVYSGSRFILIGTPSGVTLSAEGGAHQSVVTPCIGLSLPGVTYWEPCFAQELEWILLDSINSIHLPDKGEATYLRLSTAPIDQGLLTVGGREVVRAQVLSGAYCLVDHTADPGAHPTNTVQIWATGVLVPEAVKACAELLVDGVYASVWNCVSPDRVYRAWQDSLRLATRQLPYPGRAPVVTVIDGHPSALAWVGSMFGVRCHPLGVTAYGQSGRPTELYREFRIDAESICSAAFGLLDEA